MKSAFQNWLVAVKKKVHRSKSIALNTENRKEERLEIIEPRMRLNLEKAHQKSIQKLEQRGEINELESE